MKSYSLTVIGAGRLAWSLIPNLQRAGHHVVQLISRTRAHALPFQDAYHIADIQTDISQISSVSEAVLICTGDDQISHVAQALSPTDKVCIHTAGSMNISVLQSAGAHTGVLYPLVSFTLDSVVDLHAIPVFFEGEGQGRKVAEELALSLSHHAVFADSDQRMRIHIGAVFANNFTNFLYRIAANMLPEGTGFEVYQPLLQEHLRKAIAFEPQNTQTGPAIRGDKETILKHLQLLENQKEIQDLYRYFTEVINPQLKL